MTAIDAQIKQLNLNIEAKKLQILQAKSQANSKNAAVGYEAELKKFQDTLALKRQELTMWNQQASFEKQPPNANPQVQAVKQQIQQLTFEKGRLSLQQTQANQTGNKQLAAQYAPQIAARQAQITAKLQEIRLIELKAKTN